MRSQLDILLPPKTSSPVAELGRAIEAELTELGVRTRTVRDVTAVVPGAPLLVIAPHEVFAGRTIDDEAFSATLRSAMLLVLAHPSSDDWRDTLPFASEAGALLHVSDAGVAAFKRRGRRVRRVMLGYHSSFGTWDGKDEAPRPLDVAFIGRLTDHRSRALAEIAGELANREVEIHLPRRLAPAGERVLDFLAPAARNEILARSRVTLDIAADGEPAFGWLRAVQAISNGTVLVSEGSSDYSPLRPSEHFVAVEGGISAAALAAVLDDHERLERVRREAFRFLRDDLPLRQAVEQIADLAATLEQTRPPRDPWKRARSDEAAAPVRSEPTPEERKLDELHGLVTTQSAVLKKLFLDQRLLRRQVARLTHGLDNPTEPLVQISRTARAEELDGLQPDVSVVITVHNYGRFVRSALESSFASLDVEIEVVVVDDASTDNSASTVRDFMADQPDAAVTFVEQRVNTGVQRARNTAFSLARAPFAFVLDADNLVYPSGISKLRRTLLADPGAGYAYGLIERFNENGPVDLMNTGSWDAALLAQEHYIDAMALIRVDGWRHVGGYVTEQSLELGWEDYDLWLSFAMAGMHGAYVREVVGRYRAHGVSSLTTTTLDTASLQAKLRERHAPFFAAVETPD